MVENLKHKVVRGVFWVLCERFSTQVVHFVVTLFLARLLCPDDYGTISLLSIFIALAAVLADAGFGNALVQKKDADELDFNSVFYLSVALSFVMYLLLYLAAPLIADFYHTPSLVSILRVISLTLIFNSLSSVQIAELNRKLLFHLSFRISIVSTMVTAAVGIGLAFAGYGPWALVWSQVCNSVVGFIARWTIIAWRPRLMFSWQALKPLFKYGWKLIISSLLESGFSNLYGLVIGRVYAKSDLAFVEKGQQLPRLLMENVNGTFGRVAFPALAQIQDEKARVRESMRRIIVCSTFLVFPLMAFFAVSADKIIYLVFGEKWLSAVPYARLACFMFALWPFHTTNLQAIQAIGRSDVFLKLEIVKKTMGVIMLFASIRYGVLVFMVVSAFVTSPLSVLINSWPNRRLLSYTIGMQLNDVIPSAMLCACFVLPVYVIGRCFEGMSLPAAVLCVMLQGIIAVTIYFSLAIAFRTRAVCEYVSIIGHRLKKHIQLVDKLSKYLEES